MDECTANAVRFLFVDAGAKALEAKSRAKSQNEGGSGGFGFNTIAKRLDYHYIFVLALRMQRKFFFSRP